MTAQISDDVFYQDEMHTLAAMRGSGLFDPRDHGIDSPIAVNTACWRGFACTYGVVDGLLQLRELMIGLAAEQSAAVQKGEALAFLGGCSAGEDQGWKIFKQLTLPIPFTGGLLLAQDFISGMYVHMGFHPAYKYKTVYELVFESGRLISETDCSKKMAGFRKELEARGEKGRDELRESDLRGWIERCFDRSYSM